MNMSDRLKELSLNISDAKKVITSSEQISSAMRKLMESKAVMHKRDDIFEKLISELDDIKLLLGSDSGEKFEEAIESWNDYWTGDLIMLAISTGVTKCVKDCQFDSMEQNIAAAMTEELAYEVLDDFFEMIKCRLDSVKDNLLLNKLFKELFEMT